ncbi:toxic anion resistance protein [Carnobacterium gallinarum]|uniref:toxic anion resistance protein n=1 Tax=Carnobacterium gallinarum TaxID=2749 RepID=UPI0005541247|nr:toxic anion resistance protein [Carnobacterium gallinarum]
MENQDMNELVEVEVVSVEKKLSQAEAQKEQLKTLPEVINISGNIDIKDQISILEFGKEPAEGISQFSGRILNNMSVAETQKSTVMLTQLGKIMDKFEPEDFTEEKKGFLGKLFGKGKDVMAAIMAKYQTMGGEIEVVYTEIKKYEVKMKNNVHMLNQLAEENIRYYLELEKYIAAGELIAENLRNNTIPQLQTRVNNGEQMAGIELSKMTAALEMIEQRIYDLEMAKQVSLQTGPQIDMLQKGNVRLIGKINSAFVITIPVFKSALIQAVAIKQQKMTAEAMTELDNRTNEMLLKNAQNISQNSIEIAKLSGAPSIKIETMEQTWSTIMNGLEETKQIEAQNIVEREAGRKRLLELQTDYEAQKHKM